MTSVLSLATAYSRAERYNEQIAFCDSKIAVAENLYHKGQLSTLKASAYNNYRSIKPRLTAR